MTKSDQISEHQTKNSSKPSRIITTLPELPVNQYHQTINGSRVLCNFIPLLAQRFNPAETW